MREATIDFLVSSLKMLVGFLEQFDLQPITVVLLSELVTMHSFFRKLPQLSRDLFRTPSASSFLLCPHIPHLLQYIHKTECFRPSQAVVGAWPVGTTKNWLEVRRDKNVQRPASGTSSGLYIVHVNGINIRAFLAVDLDGYEGGIENLGDFGGGKGLALHDLEQIGLKFPFQDKTMAQEIYAQICALETSPEARL